MPRISRPQSAANQIRIIGGRWRGRKLDFPSVEGLRPTGDRIRETLFNWLGQNLSGTRVLDLFAGSGALGIEALSRGALSVVFVDSSGLVCGSLTGSLEKLEATGFQVHQLAAEGFLSSATPASVDLLFLDPPFAKGLHKTVVSAVSSSGILSPNAQIYVESPKHMNFDPPADWSLQRDKTAGDVRYQLYQLDCDNLVN